MQLDGPMQTLSGHPLDARVSPGDLEQTLCEQSFELAYPGQDIFAGDHAEIGADGGHTDRMTTQRSVILPTLALELLDDGLRHHDRRDRRRAAPQRFAQRHNVRTALATLKREPSPRPPRAGH